MEVFDDTALISVQYKGWMQYLFLVFSAGNLALAALFLYAQSLVLGSVFLLGALFLAALATYRIETLISKPSEAATHSTRILGVNRQRLLPLSGLSLLAKVYSHSRGRYTIVFLVAKGRRYKIAELLSAVTDTVNDPVLDNFIEKLQTLIELPYEMTF